MNKSLETQNLYEFVSYSQDKNDFIKRMGTFCGIISLELTMRLQDELKFPFHCVEIIDSINYDVVKLVNMINKTNLIDKQPKIQKELFFEMIQLNYPEVYSEYKYYKEIIKN